LALVGIKTKASMPHIPTWDVLIATNATQLVTNYITFCAFSPTTPFATWATTNS
jgi:hypothetical protein